MTASFSIVKIAKEVSMDKDSINTQETIQSLVDTITVPDLAYKKAIYDLVFCHMTDYTYTGVDYADVVCVFKNATVLFIGKGACTCADKIEDAISDAITGHDFLAPNRAMVSLRYTNDVSENMVMDIAKRFCNMFDAECDIIYDFHIVPNLGNMLEITIVGLYK